MQAKIVFRGNKCFREFDLKTVAEKLGLSIDDFNHFALAVDEKNGKTVYASVLRSSKVVYFVTLQTNFVPIPSGSVAHLSV